MSDPQATLGRPPTGLVPRALILAAGTGTYVLFLVTFLAVIAFLHGLLDRGALGLAVPAPAAGGSDLLRALAVDLGCLLLFAVQHTIMARPAFKERWTRIIPPALERPAFVLTTCAILWLTMLVWRPIGGTAYDLGAGPLSTAILGLAALGWLTVLYSSFLIDHFELFGLAQVVRAFRGLPASRTAFRERSLYRIVRHPLMAGFLLAFWSLPAATWDRLLFSVATTAYILFVGLRFEERDLRAAHPGAYADYCRRVPALVPRLRRAV